jgi:hypothetical protein
MVVARYGGGPWEGHMLENQRFLEDRLRPHEKQTRRLAVGDVLVSPHPGVIISIERSTEKMISSREGAAFAFEIKLSSGETLLSHPRAIHSLKV